MSYSEQWDRAVLRARNSIRIETETSWKREPVSIFVECFDADGKEQRQIREQRRYIVKLQAYMAKLLSEFIPSAMAP